MILLSAIPIVHVANRLVFLLAYPSITDISRFPPNKHSIIVKQTRQMRIFTDHVGKIHHMDDKQVITYYQLLCMYKWARYR
jgi:hypothetical protein